MIVLENHRFRTLVMVNSPRWRLLSWSTLACAGWACAVIGYPESNARAKVWAMRDEAGRSGSEIVTQNQITNIVAF